MVVGSNTDQPLIVTHNKKNNTKGSVKYSFIKINRLLGFWSCLFICLFVLVVVVHIIGGGVDHARLSTSISQKKDEGIIRFARGIHFFD